jgi:hypothetical protein
MATTERYRHAKARKEDVDRLNKAFALAGGAPNPTSVSG